MATNTSRYLLYRKIAQGGMADIFLAKQFGEDGFQRVCCIKRILKQFAQNEEFVGMFRDEAHIGKRLQHANIVRIEGFEAIDDSYGIVMEYVLGADLKTILGSTYEKKCRPTIPMIVYIIAEVARGLHFAHVKRDDISQQPLGIVHRDISPQNILISYEGEVKVTDFGIAEASKRNTETQVGMVKGKFSYMSPEQLRGLPVDARTDVFALCVVFWEALALEKCFTGANEGELVQNVLGAKIRRDVRELNPEVDAELYEIIQKGLSKEPEGRFASAGDLERELRLFLNHKYASFTPEDLGKYVKELLKERRQEILDRLRDLLMDTSKPEGWSEAGQLGANPTAEGNFRTTNKLAKTEDLAKSLKIQSGITYQPVPTIASHGRIVRTQNSKYRLGDNLHRAKKSYLSRLRSLFLIGCVALGGGGAYHAWRIKLAKENLLQVEVIPDRVKITLDKVPLKNGSYINTPYQINFAKPGHHELLIQRFGFRDEVVSFDVKKNSILYPRRIVLEALGDSAPVKISLVSHASKPVYVDIAQGLISQTLSPASSAKVSDLPARKKISMSVYSKPNGEKLFTCVFIPQASSWEKPFWVVIHPELSKCRASLP